MRKDFERQDDRVYRLIKSFPKGLTTEQITEISRFDGGKVSRAVNKLMEKGLIKASTENFRLRTRTFTVVKKD